MREIKFRAWDKEELAMLDDVCTWTDDFTDMLNTTFRYWKDGNLILMQYTGLKDKNGIEIYEGDIVQRTMHYGDDDGNSVGEGENTKSVVAWGEDVGSQFVGFSLFPCDDIYKLEVIGNINENPELIKPKGVSE